MPDLWPRLGNQGPGSETVQVDWEPFGRDPRYTFQGFDPELLTALGRMVLGSCYLEGSAGILLARLVDNDDLAVGQRLAANSSFPWLLDHIRALAEVRLTPEQHTEVVAWSDRARVAYAQRSRIVHADWGVDATSEVISFFFMRKDARKETFTEETWAAAADEVHAVAQELERVGLAAVSLMAYMPQRPTTS